MPLSHTAVVVPRSHRLRLILLSLSVTACSAEETAAGLPSPPGDRFADDVYPVLLRDCGMAHCHGDEQRFFRVVGPGRTRLSATTDLLAPATPQEILWSNDRTVSMLEPAPHTRASLLLRKPLELSAGGASHEGSDAYGRNVYADPQMEGYQTISSWALSQMNDAEAAP
jgi:hypothetical protein